MILLQFSSDSLNIAKEITSGYSFWFIFEIVLIIGVILYQLYHSRNVFLNIEELKQIFKNRIVIKNGFIEKDNLSKKKKTLDDIVFIDNDEDSDSNDLFSDQNILNISIAETSGKDIIKSMTDDINNYLLNNYGATVNFSFIKDIIDREVDIKDEEVSHSIPTPLYLGLAATMIGIIFGLFSMPELSGAHLLKGIDALINGVKLAMFGSLSGLACTTILSSFFYKNAKKKVLKDKNQQISYLQARLLPELIRAEDTGVSGLKTSIDRFARDTTGLATILYNTTLKTESNLKIQQEIIQRIDRIDVLKVSKANLELLDKLEKNIHSFNQFASYLDLMGRISSQLQDFASRTANIDGIAKHIDGSLAENKKLIEFLSSHFSKIENAGNAALSAVDIADSHFREAIERLTLSTQDTLDALYKSINESSSRFAEAIENLNNEIKTRTENINQNATDHESKITEIYNDIGTKLKIITDEHLSQLETTFKEATPKFDELKHLTALPVIKEQLINDHNSNGKKFIDVVMGLNDSLQKVKENLYQERYLQKLVSIEEILKKQNSKQNTRVTIRNSEEQKKFDQIETKELFEHINKPVSIIDAIKVGLFKKSKNGK